MYNLSAFTYSELFYNLSHCKYFKLYFSQQYAEILFATIEANFFWMWTNLNLLISRKYEFKRLKLNYLVAAYQEGLFKQLLPCFCIIFNIFNYFSMSHIAYCKRALYLKTLAFRKNRIIRFPPWNHEMSVENREFRNFLGKSWIFTKFC